MSLFPSVLVWSMEIGYQVLSVYMSTDGRKALGKGL